mmetsp:Transcript_18679/g.44621  ORF Transcript_18679/g.44621 Transcript_18679/m.44621 type:complete len:154 (+) Transcript_18679:44-505(+)
MTAALFYALLFLRQVRQGYCDFQNLQLRCQECLDITAFIEADLWAAYPHRQELSEDEDVGLVGRTRQRRRMIPVWSELVIFDVLDSACEKHAAELAHPLHLHLRKQCDMIVAVHRHSMENYLFSNGPQGFQELVCAQLLQVCQAHDIEGYGEL